MEIRMTYKDDKAEVFVVENQHDRFIDPEVALRACLEELQNLVNSMCNERLKEEY